VVLWALSLTTALLQATLARLPRRHGGWRSRLRVAALCYAQPLVRSWARYRTRWFPGEISRAAPATADGPPPRLPTPGRAVCRYWGTDGCIRAVFLNRLLARLAEQRWGAVIDRGWSDWDVRIDEDGWTALQLCTVGEDHGSGKYLFRVRYRLRFSVAGR